MAQEASGSVSVADVAAGTGLHVNTARFHLERLVEEGRVERHAEEGGGRGRPRVLYRPRLEPDEPHSYRLLAQMMTGLAGSLDPTPQEVADTGRGWGERLVAGAQGAGTDAAIERLDVVSEAMGFGQSHHGGGPNARLHIHQCPFLDVAGQHTRIVCELHRGLLEGAVTGLDTSVELQPFAQPGRCIARLHPKD